ncbi:Phthiocerol/phenolphthiocerol synthesis polyketide synthase type I PpsA [Labrenzia sp. THAF82]|uniref:type I polyketide synthase n=1 Tax=Labrenzia sp. THAF82 TaxID=2587861 RepID=UPI0012684FC8|nr:type I polyketide synthase [Labrenzia sp. THAF82]QFT32211.1 Phthiocerol/phenolphthiocerol synthesis polyketide synthase type I PpsA [Labrenzia sp. THAF82]
MNKRVAIVSLACRFAEATQPDALWRNVLEGRRSFRQIPPERLALVEYVPDRIGPFDAIDKVPAGLISDWEFRRDRFRVPKSTFEAADLAHWLALETAVEAVNTVGGAGALSGLRTAVILGNTLTGEFSRSAQLRLRLPYLQRHLQNALSAAGLSSSQVSTVQDAFSSRVRQDFPDPNEETLAGALANTIAGRIANYLDLDGGAWTVDGACASSLLAIADGCGRIADGSTDLAIVGGVDLSLDPFELVGFSRTGALAKTEMRVFDKRAAGFWPGEGCGIAVIASESAAALLKADPLAWIAGWGVSTDGAGGLTRPGAEGQIRAIERAWTMAGAAPRSAGYFEAHGTGTVVGDATEIRALADAIGTDGLSVPVGSIKANIGHCKAAAGIAGLIKTVKALESGIVPPHVSCDEPNEIFAGTGHRLKPARADLFPEGKRLAGVSAFGFGGINAHVVVCADQTPATAAIPSQPCAQSSELFVFAADSLEALQTKLKTLADRTPAFSLAEISEAAADCAAATRAGGRFRAGFVASTPSGLHLALKRELERVHAPVPETPRIGFLFPGQAAPARGDLGSWTRRFGIEQADQVERPAEGAQETQWAQPLILSSSLIGLDLMARVGVSATLAAGHSLGEFAALSWAGALSPGDALNLVMERGMLMVEHGRPGGAMMRLPLSVGEIKQIGLPEKLEIACLNGERETVVAGPATAIERWSARLRADGVSATALKVSHAFHTSAMSGAKAPFEKVLKRADFAPLKRTVLSTVTGSALDPTPDLPALLTSQLTAPVKFSEALAELSQNCDLLIEIGPGQGLARLADAAGTPAASLDVGSSKLDPLLMALALCWEAGAGLNLDLLFSDRPLRPLGEAPRLLANPCGAKPGSDHLSSPAQKLSQRIDLEMYSAPSGAAGQVSGNAVSTLETVRAAVCEALSLPAECVPADARLLDDLHLNSLSVGRIVQQSAAALGLSTPAIATDLSGETVEGLASFLDEIAEHGPALSTDRDVVEGVAPWIADFARVWEPVLGIEADASAQRSWRCYGPEPVGLNLKTDADSGLVSVLDLTGSREAAKALFDRVKSARADGVQRIALLHKGLALSGFARSLIKDGVFKSVACVDLQGLGPERTLAALLDTIPEGYSDLRIEDGKVERSCLQRVDAEPGAPDTGLNATDVLCVSGGAKGIGAESALHLARQANTSLLLLGRSPPSDPEVQETLTRARELGLIAEYLSVDLSDLNALRAALRTCPLAERVSAILHAAGVNEPKQFDKLDPADLDQAMAAKVTGLENLLTAFRKHPIRLVVGFGSIIGEIGLAGEAHYALANGLMSARLEAWGKASSVLVLALDWSVWAGAGMGERLGAVERLAASGVEAIPLTTALEHLSTLVASARTASGRRIVTGRFGPPDDVSIIGPPLPLARFAGTVRQHTSEVELVLDTAIAPGADPWLSDHKVDGTAVVPGVMLLEAMAQAAKALTGQDVTGFRELAFHSAILPPDAGLTLRIAVLQQTRGTVTAAVRASDDGYRVDRASATIDCTPQPEINTAFEISPDMDIDGAHIYDGLCFNTGRFKRIARLQHLTAYELRASFSERDPRPWFGPYEAQDMCLGDPATRDAGLHVLQACVPQRRVLPVSVERVTLADAKAERHSVEAREVWSDGQRFVFDILWRDRTGRPVEQWHAVCFQSVGDRKIDDLPYQLLPAAMQRAADLFCNRKDIHVAICNSMDRKRRRERVLDTLHATAAGKRGDGMQLIEGSDTLSLSHNGSLTFGLRGSGVLACDLVVTTNGVPPALSPGDGRVLDMLEGLDSQFASVVTWSARECARKGGLPPGQPLIPLKSPAPGLTVFRCGPARILCQRRKDSGCAAILLSPGTRRTLEAVQ